MRGTYVRIGEQRTSFTILMEQTSEMRLGTRGRWVTIRAAIFGILNSELNGNIDETGYKKDRNETHDHEKINMYNPKFFLLRGNYCIFKEDPSKLTLKL